MPYKNPHPLYYIWAKLRYRARKSGAFVCSEWESFQNFLNDIGEKQEGMILTLIDDSLGYIKGNLVWVLEADKVKVKKNYKPSVTHPLYVSWRSMIDRCRNPNNPHYKNYGGRGITVCDRWLNDFHAYVNDMGERPPGTSIDRMNNDLGYTKDNCRWATKRQQQANRRVNVLISFNGQTRPLKHWADDLGIKSDTLAGRIERGIPLNIALTVKTLPRNIAGLSLGGKASGAIKLARTHCRHGHEFTPENTYITKDGSRSCRKCHAERERIRRK